MCLFDQRNKMEMNTSTGSLDSIFSYTSYIYSFLTNLRLLCDTFISIKENRIDISEKNTENLLIGVVERCTEDLNDFAHKMNKITNFQSVSNDEKALILYYSPKINAYKNHLEILSTIKDYIYEKDHINSNTIQDFIGDFPFQLDSTTITFNDICYFVDNDLSKNSLKDISLEETLIIINKHLKKYENYRISDFNEDELALFSFYNNKRQECNAKIDKNTKLRELFKLLQRQPVVDKSMNELLSRILTLEEEVSELKQNMENMKKNDVNVTGNDIDNGIDKNINKDEDEE